MPRHYSPNGLFSFPVTWAVVSQTAFFQTYLGSVFKLQEAVEIVILSNTSITLSS